MPQVARPPNLTDVRHEILARAIGELGAREGALFELAEASALAYRPTVTSPGLRDKGRSAELPRESLLPRWLRVNESFLPVPDTIGVFERLSEHDQSLLRDLAIDGCLPLVHQRRLAGWIALTGRASPTRADGAAAQAPRWAMRLSEAKALSFAQARAETVARTNRLTVTGQLAAHIAHEVRNPLAIVRSTVQMMRDGKAPVGDYERLFGIVIDEVDRAKLVLQEMLTLGRPRTTLDEECDLRVVADRASSFCEAYARQSGQRIDVSGTGRLPVVGDPWKLRQVLVNLLLNACQASDVGTRVLVETFASADPSGPPMAGVRVSDSGSGISTDRINRVFDPFYTTKVNGTGLGLAISREIIQRHGGDISLTSQEGVGTTVTIRLPLIPVHGPHSGR